MKTFMPKIDPDKRDWHVLDLENVTLGRAACKVADILRGKNKPIFTPHMDCGDHVVVINAEKVRVNGKNKPENLRYYRYSGYLGGLKSVVMKDQLEQHPERVILHAVRGMLPKNRLGRAMIKKLKVYPGAHHPHAAQKPEPLSV